MMKGIETVFAPEREPEPRLLGGPWAGWARFVDMVWRTASGWKTSGLGTWRRGKESDMGRVGAGVGVGAGTGSVTVKLFAIVYLL